MEKTIRTTDDILNELIRSQLAASGRWEIDDEDIEMEKQKVLRRLVYVVLGA